MTISMRGSTTTRRTRTRPYVLEHLFPVLSTGALAYRGKLVWRVLDKSRRCELYFRNVFRAAGDEILLQVDREGAWVASRVRDWSGVFFGAGGPFPLVTNTIQFVTGTPRVRRRGHFIMLEHGGSTVCLHMFGLPPLCSWEEGLEF